MILKLYLLLKLLRPKQWMKNFALFAAIVFTGQLFNFFLFYKVSLAFLAFCAMSSGVYIINDIFDISSDRKHPFKRLRPLASGKIPLPLAIIISIVLILAAVYVSTLVTRSFLFAIIIYLLLQLSYSLFLKHIEVIDILIVATGYMIRVFGGEFASGSRVTVWLLLTTIALSLFLAVGKRKSELTLISHLSDKALNETRKTLSHYSDKLLDVYAAVFATATFVFYSLFTFSESSSYKPTLAILLPDYLPSFFMRKWLMITIVPVVYGLMRYLQDIYENAEGESPEKVLLSDGPLLASVFIWIILVISIIYVIGA